MKPISSDPALQEEPMFGFLDPALYGEKGEKFNDFILSHQIAELIHD